jgi:two-component system, OmpR family, sensor histidine kinase ChvG
MTASTRLTPVAKGRAPRRGEVILGEDWVTPDALADQEFSAARSKRSVVALNRSPLARKIILFNLMALVIMVSGILYLSPHRDGLTIQQEKAMVAQAWMTAQLMSTEVGKPGSTPDGLLADVPLDIGTRAFLYNKSGTMVSNRVGTEQQVYQGATNAHQTLFATKALDRTWNFVSGVLSAPGQTAPQVNLQLYADGVADRAKTGMPQVFSGQAPDGTAVFAVAVPVLRGSEQIGMLALARNGLDVDGLVNSDREQILQMFMIALLVSIGLSIVLASTISNPLSDLAAAAELGRDRDSRKISGRVRIPDLTARPDEIGRLSVAMRGMVAALYDRIDSNEQFAADVAHEIKNPLASLRSAVGTMRVAKRDDQREKLLEVIEHDVRRLDRLVSDISNASRLDSELVKEEEEQFDLMKTVMNLANYLSKEAGEKGVEFITDLPKEPIIIRGLEGRLAQVVVNLITNAISFCQDGDAVRVWARRRGNRVLVVVEDTGPGIPEQALTKVFKRFYSERPEGQFGNHSGLGLAISKQIVEAHGGVIWAENIRPNDAETTSDPLGARFVVGLPV